MGTLSSCGRTVGGTAGDQSPSATATAQVRHQPGNVADTALARSALLKTSELPAGWTLVGQSDYAVTDLPSHFCMTGYPGYVAGSGVDYSYHLDLKTNNEQGHLEAYIRLTNSEADAQRQLAMLTSPDANTSSVSQCVVDAYRSILAQAVGANNLLPGARLLPTTTPPGSLPGLIFRASVPYRFLNSNKVMYFDDIRVQKGRFVAGFLFMTCCTAFDYANGEQSAVNAVATRITSAAAADGA
jgi:hypothetical protein